MYFWSTFLACATFFSAVSQNPAKISSRYCRCCWAAFTSANKTRQGKTRASWLEKLNQWMVEIRGISFFLLADKKRARWFEGDIWGVETKKGRGITSRQRLGLDGERGYIWGVDRGGTCRQRLESEWYPSKVHGIDVVSGGTQPPLPWHALGPCFQHRLSWGQGQGGAGEGLGSGWDRVRVRVRFEVGLEFVSSKDNLAVVVKSGSRWYTIHDSSIKGGWVMMDTGVPVWVYDESYGVPWPY